MDAASEADIELISWDELIIFVFLTCFPDEKIQEIVSARSILKLEDLRLIADQCVDYLRGKEAINSSKTNSVIAAVNPNRPTSGITSASTPGHPAPPTRHQSTNDQRPRQPGSQRSGQQHSFWSRRSEAMRSRFGHCNGVDHRLDNCFVLVQNLSCYECGQPGHIMPACHSCIISAILQDIDDNPEVMPRLPVSFIHANGTFSFECFPDSGSATSLISANLESLHRLPIQPRSSWTVFVSVNGVRLHIHSKVLLDVKDLNGDVHRLHLLVSSDITKEVLLGYKILHELGIVLKDFPQFPVSVIKADVFITHTCLWDVTRTITLVDLIGQSYHVILKNRNILVQN